MNEKNALGWSSTFMKQGLAFVFLLLFQGEKFPEGMKAMQSRAKSVCDMSADKFYRGTEINSKLSDNELFSQLFIMEKYRNEYSRRSAFRKELVAYGMK